MTLVPLLLLAVGASADAFAVALGRGLCLRRDVVRNGLILAGAFALAQAIMPLIGWALGSAFAAAIAPIEPWLAFVLLALIGVKMLWQAFTTHDDTTADTDRFTIREVVVLAVATSADALVIGVSLTAWNVSIWLAIGVLGVVTFVVSFVAVLLGQRIGTRFRRPAEIMGGLVLIGSGVVILVEHFAA